jgi:hypothetical protein
MSPRVWRLVSSAVAIGAACFLAAGSSAGAPCSSLPSPIYVTGSSTPKNVLAGLAQAWAATQTIVYASPGSCAAWDAILNGTPTTGTATYWDATGTAQTCTLDPAGNAADLGLSDVFVASCPASYGFPSSLPSGVGDFFGPVQVVGFVVPTASSQTLLSVKAAYFLYGFPQGGQVAPWANTNNDANILQGGTGSTPLMMLAPAIGVPLPKWQGTVVSGSAAMLTAVANSTSPEATLGLLGADAFDANRSVIKVLAYQHTDQECAWLPDSSPTSFDKQNVRDGHYPLWGPLHMAARVDTSGNPVSPGAGALIGVLTGKTAPPAGLDLLHLEIGNHQVPACAMHVQRASELGPLSAYKPAQSCDCYFAFQATGNTTCTSCTTQSDCTGSTTCVLHGSTGYCEAK